MNPINAPRLSNAFRSYADLSDWHAPYAVTLTLRQTNVVENDRGRRFDIQLTPDIASRNFRHFLNLLNGNIFGKAATRFGRSVNVIPILEGGNGKRLHYHAVIDCPRDELRETFPATIATCWLRTDWGYWEHHIVPHADSGWIDYISKLRDKLSFADAIDWTNCHGLERRV